MRICLRMDRIDLSRAPTGNSHITIVTSAAAASNPRPKTWKIALKAGNCSLK